MAKANIVEFGVAVETSPGVAETIVVGDVDIRLREGYATELDQQLFDLNELKSNSSKTASIAGRRLANFNVSHVLRGPGDLITEPAVANFLKASLFTSTAAKAFTPGSITGGPFVPGETITGSVTGATGLVLAHSTATEVAYIPLTSDFNTMDLSVTGDVSGADTSVAMSPAAAGYAFRPADPDLGTTGHHVTAKFFRDGYQWTGRGCLADFNLTMENGGPGIVSQTFVGALESAGDEAILNQTAYPESTVTPPQLLNAGLRFGTTAFNPTGIREVSIAFPTNPAVIEDINSANTGGVLYAGFSRDLPTITFEADQILAATYDYFQKLNDGDTNTFEMTLGDTSGSRWTFSASASQFRSIRPGVADPNRATFAVEVGLTGTNNNEFLIWQH